MIKETAHIVKRNKNNLQSNSWAAFAVQAAKEGRYQTTRAHKERLCENRRIQVRERRAWRAFFTRVIIYVAEILPDHEALVLTPRALACSIHPNSELKGQ